jgi:hypothetical protein
MLNTYEDFIRNETLKCISVKYMRFIGAFFAISKNDNNFHLFKSTYESYIRTTNFATHITMNSRTHFSLFFIKHRTHREVLETKHRILIISAFRHEHAEEISVQGTFLHVYFTKFNFSFARSRVRGLKRLA